MRVVSLYLEGYVGILNGLNLEKIFIDFTKCKNNIIIIKGSNGSGKTSLFKTIHPLNDSNESFCPNMNAKKIIAFYDNETGIMYTNTFTSEIRNGTRINRGYVSKTLPSGEVVELNPNGNITECRELIFDIFKLDPNFISLSQLSSDDRGLADKKPADRKKFVNSIMSQLSVYNNMNKSLAKRSSIFKSTINSINSKIANIGNEELLNANLASLDNRIKELERIKENKIMSIAVNTEALSSLSKDDSVKLYNELSLEKTNLLKEESELSSQLFRLKSNLPEDYDIKLYTSKHNEVTNYRDKLLSENEILFKNIELETDELEKKSIKLAALRNDSDYMKVKTETESLKNELTRLKEVLSNSEVKDPDNTDAESYKLAIQIILDTKNIIDYILGNYDYNTVQRCLSTLEEEKEVISQDTIDAVRNTISNLMVEITRLSSKKEYADKWVNIPSNCTLKEECYFVKDIVSAGKGYSDELLNKLSNELKDNENVLRDLLNKKKQNDLENSFYSEIYKVYANIRNSSSILSKIKGTEIILSKEAFNKAICNNITLDVSGIRNVYNELLVYNNIKQTLFEYEKKLYEFASRDALVNEISQDIQKIDSKINDLRIRSMNITKSINDLDLQIVKLKSIIDNISVYNTIKANLEDCNNRIDIITLDLDIHKASADKVICLKQTLDKEISELEFVKSELKPLYENRDTTKFNLIKLSEYIAELNEYNLKYEKIEIVKQATSPTSGIQTLFMEMYMNKIIEMANQLICFLFEGKFVLHPFVINETEFRIPCSGNKLMNDDISSMSTSQICMISMVLSFALLFHSSTKYNILKLDEIDGGLDADNRLHFILLLDKLMQELKCEQCIMISHNNELNLKNSDIIALKVNEKLDGNIIYDYYKEVR